MEDRKIVPDYSYVVQQPDEPTTIQAFVKSGSKDKTHLITPSFIKKLQRIESFRQDTLLPPPPLSKMDKRLNKTGANLVITGLSIYALLFTILFLIIALFLYIPMFTFPSFLLLIPAMLMGLGFMPNTIAYPRNIMYILKNLY